MRARGEGGRKSVRVSESAVLSALILNTEFPLPKEKERPELGCVFVCVYIHIVVTC